VAGKNLAVGSYDQHLFLECGNAAVILAVGPRNPKERRIDTTGAGAAAGRLAYVCSECVHAIGPHHCQFAGCGLARGLVVVTSNEAAFRRVGGLRIENWRGANVSCNAVSARPSGSPARGECTHRDDALNAPRICFATPGSSR
jgi:hypothetical protein